MGTAGGLKGFLATMSHLARRQRRPGQGEDADPDGNLQRAGQYAGPCFLSSLRRVGQSP